MPIVIEIAGSSTVMSGSGRGCSGSASVSPIMISGMPAIAHDVARAGRCRRDPLEGLGDEQLGDLDVLRAAVPPQPGHLLALAQRALVDAHQREPAEERAGVEVGDVGLQRRALGVRRGRDGLDDRAEQRLEVGGVGQRAVGGHARGWRGRPSRWRRRPGSRARRGSGSRRAGRGTARRSRRRPRLIRASGRSTLLTTSTTGRSALSALRSTNRVWGSGPSLASTSSTMPSTIDSPRSTSPPKSAWPGVSMMLIVIGSPPVASAAAGPAYGTAVFLARIVMPFSRSSSPESIARSSTCWCSPKEPGLPQHRVDQRGLAVVDVRDDRDVAQVGPDGGRERTWWSPGMRGRFVRGEEGGRTAEVHPRRRRVSPRPVVTALPAGGPPDLQGGGLDRCRGVQAVLSLRASASRSREQRRRQQLLEKPGSESRSCRKGWCGTTRVVSGPSATTPADRGLPSIMLDLAEVVPGSERPDRRAPFRTTRCP